MAISKYTRKKGTTITAVKLDLDDCSGFNYQKWGGVQTCKQGDWIVCNQGETYTIDGETFAATYEKVSPGVYAKFGDVWAEQAENDGSIDTKEGASLYLKGDWLVYNNEDLTDGYCMGSEKFASLYVPA